MKRKYCDDFFLFWYLLSSFHFPYSSIIPLFISFPYSFGNEALPIPNIVKKNKNKKNLRFSVMNEHTGEQQQLQP